MASTQKLTELPVIQYTGMDYTTVISQIKSIIESNNNWKENWTQFYSSEAGTMLIQLMAWICDNLAVRQDLLYNESFISTAKNYTSKLRFLNQIKYDIKCSKAATVPITINLNSITEKKINLSCYGYLKGSNYEIYKDYTPQQRVMQGIRSIKNSIFSFQAPNINGENVNWEILNINEDGGINYDEPVVLDVGDFEYNKYDNGNKTLKALQGVTTYKEFSSDTSNEPIFNTYEKDIDLDSLVVYDIKGSNYTPTFQSKSKHIRVQNFIDITSLKNDIPCYVVERDDDGYIQIRYPSVELGKSSKNNLLANHLYKAGHTVGVFYRKCNGSDGNISENIFNVKATAKDEDEKNVNITITNVLAGYGGFNMENIDTAIKNAPLTLRTLNRAVTSDDYDIILNNNNFVLKSKTFTPDNMPTYFSSFYGREIWPHEVFSIVVSNKNIKNIPNEYLNKFPWIETNKSHAINEKVSFTEHDFNNSITKKFGPSFGFFIKDNYVSEGFSTEIPVKKEENNINESKKEICLNCSTDNGTLYKEEFSANKSNNSGMRLLKNAVVYNSSNSLLNYILNEKEKYTGNNNPYELIVKLNSERYYGNSFKDIRNVFFEENELSVNKNILTQDVNATFTSIENFTKYSDGISGTYEKIDVSKIDRPIKINIDDSFDFEINIKEIIKEEYVRKCKDFLSAINVVENDDDFVDLGLNYTINIPNDEFIENSLTNTTEIYNIFLSNSHYDNNSFTFGGKDEKKAVKTYLLKNKNNSEAIINFFKDVYNGETRIVNQEMEDFSSRLVLLRMGLVQLINEAYEKELKTLENIENNTDKNKLKKYEWISRQLETFKNNCFSSDTDIDGKFFGTLYQDIGLNFPSFLNAQIEEEERKKMPFYREEGDKAHFYRIRLGNKKYAIRIDKTVLKQAFNFFFKGDDAASTGYDVFKFNGVFGETSSVLTNPNLISISSNIVAEINNHYSNKIFSTEKIKQVLKATNSSYFASYDENKNDICLCAESLALVLEYLFSPFNTDEETVYELEEDITGARQWVDLKQNKKILDGSLRVYSVTKKYYNYNSINKYNFDDEKYNGGLCTDVRFEYIRSPNKSFSFGSVSEAEIMYSDPSGDNSITPTITIKEENDSIKTEDFFEALFDCRKNFTTEFPDENKKIANIIMNDDETVKFSLTSKKKGQNSSIYLSSSSLSSDTSNTKDNTIFNIFNCANTSLVKQTTDGNDIFDVYTTEKAYGIRRMEMFNSGITFDSEEAEAYSGEKTVTLQVGDIILTDNDINMINIPDITYLSYISSYNNEIPLSKQTSLYYSDNEETAKAMEINVTGLDGQVVKSSIENGEIVYKIDEKSSSFKIKVTDEEIDYTNNFNCIDDGNLKRYVKSEAFSLTTMDIKPLSISEDVKLIFAIDSEIDKEIPADSIAIDINLSELDAKKIYNSVIGSIPQEHNYYNDRYKIIRLYSNNYGGSVASGNDNRLVFSNIDNRDTGNITFYCDDDNNEGESELFKVLFGTSRTNSMFYKLYPKEEVNEKNINGDDEEYWYSPVVDSPLVFKFRTFTNVGKVSNIEELESKYADYYINCHGTGFAKNNSDSDGYKFELVRTETSALPDGDFYVHYINDRTYEKNRNTEEDQLNKYMEKYIIAGTKMNYLNPFFRTFDISGNVYYNENFNAKNIAENVNKALNAKYKIENISNIDVGNKIYLSDIIKLITSVDGVEHVEITYFGFDITDRSNYPSSSKYLSISEECDFYTIILLAETDNKHGIQLSYAINEE